MMYRIEIRMDYEGTEDHARSVAAHAANVLSNIEALTGVEVTAIFDEDWEEL